MGNNDYAKILSPERPIKKANQSNSVKDSSDLDHASIIYSSAFRRLQKKAQVFSLEDNAAIRSRLTHSLEVAEVGWRIASKVAEHLYGTQELDSERVVPFARFVETACLMHDLGNPPFGHLGEYAIRKWFEKLDTTRPSGQGTQEHESTTEAVMLSAHPFLQDFLQFDGNAQGIRLVARLQNLCPFEQCGLNLTYTQLLSLIKYPCSTDKTDENSSKYKKPGYFQTEKCLVDEANQALGREPGTRFPLSYIMEAADDIAYCMSDIEDGIEKGIVSVRDLVEYLQAEDCSDGECVLSQISSLIAQSNYRDKIMRCFNSDRDHGNATLIEQKTAIEVCEVRYAMQKHDYYHQHPEEDMGDDVAFYYCERELFNRFKIEVTGYLIGYAVDRYVANQLEFFNGKAKSIFSTKNSGEGECKEDRCLRLLKSFSKEKLYNRDEVEKKELAGYAIINALLDHFKPLLLRNRDDFRALAYDNRDYIEFKHLDIEKRLFHKLPKSYVFAYKHCVENPPEGFSGDYEWMCRAHLIVDYISGMTDDFALKTYRELSGITIG